MGAPQRGALGATVCRSRLMARRMRGRPASGGAPPARRACAQQAMRGGGAETRRWQPASRDGGSSPASGGGGSSPVAGGLRAGCGVTARGCVARRERAGLRASEARASEI